jgi:hypothetical protein
MKLSEEKRTIFEDYKLLEVKNRSRLLELYTEPRVVGIIGDIGSSKSNTAYFIIDQLLEIYDMNLYTFGLRKKIKGSIAIFQVSELERLRNAIVFLDEANLLLDIENRTKKKKIQEMFQLLAHNNCHVTLISPPNTFKKFLSAKLDAMILHEITIAQCINRSYVADTVQTYSGLERGSTMLSLQRGKAILFDGLHYHPVSIPYMKDADTKKDNPPLLRPKIKG